MKTTFLGRAAAAFICTVLLCSFFTTPFPQVKIKFPYRQAGLTERQAAAHLLNRFSYGATPAQIDAVVNMGLENWFEEQLKANLPDDTLNKHLSNYTSLSLSNEQILSKYPQNNVVTRMAVKDSVISQDSVGRAVDRKAYNEKINNYMLQKGWKPEQELYKEFISQNILRAVYSRNQLQEVLTNFWLNHFNVSLTKGECAQFLPDYERDVIRPNVFGKFDKLLIATAKSPAMLYYLDNFTSVGPPTTPTKNAVKPVLKPKPKSANEMGMMTEESMQINTVVKPAVPGKNIPGLNENYAREVMELHTLGVDGGYTQSDVTQAARVLTGWTIYPIASYGSGSSMKGLVDRIGENNLTQKGFIREGDFLFTPTRHDNGEKTVLNKHFPVNGGYEEGVELLEMLAHHPSAAKFISKKLAIRFVSDNPPASLLKKMAGTFTKQDGDLTQVLITMVTAPEFWSKNALREKTKSPFELAVSAIRGLNADVKDPYALFTWITRMGQRMYYYQAPTGFPDKGQYWINTGSLLNRMNFGLALTSQQISGIKVNLLALNNGHEPESANDAMVTYSQLVMPERNLDKTFKQLTPLLNDPNLATKVTNAASSTPVKSNKSTETSKTGTSNTELPEQKVPVKVKPPTKANATMMAQVVGIIIGSPEFQRR